MRVHFSTNPATLAATAAFRNVGSGAPLELPTPTLLGQPTDAAGYQAVLHAYGVHVISAAIAKSMG